MAEESLRVRLEANFEEFVKGTTQAKKALQELKAEEAKSGSAIKTAKAEQNVNKQRIADIKEELALKKRLNPQRRKKIADLEKERRSLSAKNGVLTKTIKAEQQLLKVNAQQQGVAQQNISDIQKRTSLLENLSKPALRYALYDVSQTLQRAALAFAAFSAVPVGFAIKYEREFANVIRTNELAGESARETRDELLAALRDIAQATPVPWKDITDIATLAGQLGIAQDLVADFTETVAKFSATTDLSVDAAATGFGRLNQLITGVDGQFEELGSSILAVGVDSVATESAIVAVSTNIASMGNLAGLTASDIVGLSGAIASLGIRPELARGNITRLFSNINKSVALSGFNLEEYGRLTGRTADEFAEAWSSEPTEVLLDFFQGIAREGASAERTLRSLGITSVRDIPAILRLAQSQDEVRRLIEISNDAFSEGTKINEQYAIISGTTAEEIRRLTQNLATLGATVGGVTLDPIADFISLLNSGVIGLSDFLGGDGLGGAGQVLSGFVVVVSAIIAALLALGSAIAIATAGFSALIFTSKTVGVNITAFGLKAIFTGKTLQTLALKVGITDAALKKLSLQAKLTGIAFGAVTAILAAAGFVFDYYAQRQQRVLSLSNDLVDSNFDLRRAVQEDTEAFAESNRQLGIGGDALRIYTTATERTTQSMQSSTDATGELTGGLKEIAASGSSASESLESFVAIGDQVVLSLLKQAAASENFAFILENQQLSGIVTQQFGGAEGFFTQAIADSDVIRQQLIEIREQTIAASRFRIFNEDFTGLVDKKAVAEDLEQIDALIAALDSIDAIGDNDALAKIAEDAEILAARTALADGQISAFAETLFGAINKTKAAEDAVGEFYAALEGGENVIDVSNEKFQDLITSIAATGDPQQAIANLLAIQDDLAQKGLLTAAVSETLSSALIELALAGNFANTALDVTPELLAEIGAIGASVLPIITGGWSEYTGAATGAAKATKTLAEEFDELLDSIFGPVNAAQDAAESVYDLGVAYAELGENAFFASDEIQSAVSDILASSGSAEEGVANLNALYARLAQTVGSETAPSLAFLRNTINQVAQEFGVAQEAVAGFANIDLDFFTSGLREVSEEVRTLLDYAGDLDKVISRAFDIRFASTFDIDRIAESWFDLGQTVEDARYQVEELIASQKDLSSDRALKEYFLSVADAYGDTLRATQLRQEIAELDREQARNARELTEAQQISGGVLTGQGTGIRQNRSALLGLVQEYQDYITTLAESGATQEELTEATEKARREFIAQARELGFQEDVVLQYAEAFDDVRVAIDSVPRNITVDANTNPAIQALNELNAKLNESISLAERLNQVQGQPTPARTTTTTTTTTPRTGVASDAALRAALGARPDQTVIGGRVVSGSGSPAGETSVDANRVTVRSSGPINVTPTGGSIRALEAAANRAAAANRFNIPNPSYLFADGGFTGRGARMEPAGIVHRGEYVIPKQYVNQSSGLPDPSFLAQLQNGMRGYQMGGFVGGGGMAGGDAMMVELSPYDRKLLENAGNVQLRLNGKVVAEATNQSNFNQARRGSD